MPCRAAMLLGVALVCAALSACAGDGGDDPARPAPATDARSREAAKPSERSGPAPDEARAPRSRADRGESESKAKRRDKGRPASPEAKAEIRGEMALARELITAFIDGLNDHDPSICTRLFDQSRVERSERHRLVAGCRRETRERKGGVELVAIESTNVELTPRGARASVQFVIESGGKRARYVYTLSRVGEEPYRIDGALPVKQPT